VTPETLQSLSVGVVCVGLFLTALGGFGTFHFGHRLAQQQEEQRTVAVQTLAEIVNGLQEDQRALRQQVAVIAEREEKEALPPPVASGPPDVMSANPSSAVSLALPTPTPIPNLFLPHPLADTQPPAAAESEQAAPAVKPPKLQLSPKPEPAAEVAPTTTPEEDALTGRGKRARLIRHLRNHAGQDIDIRAAAQDARAIKLAASLKSVFREAGWSVGEVEAVTHELPAQTLTLSTGAFPPTKEFVAAYGALAAAGFLVTSELAPHQGPHRVALSIGPLR